VIRSRTFAGPGRRQVRIRPRFAMSAASIWPTSIKLREMGKLIGPPVLHRRAKWC
jgi:hypothetical protein